jgi:hypothetical protein
LSGYFDLLLVDLVFAGRLSLFVFLVERLCSKLGKMRNLRALGEGRRISFFVRARLGSQRVLVAATLLFSSGCELERRRVIGRRLDPEKLSTDFLTKYDTLRGPEVCVLCSYRIRSEGSEGGEEANGWQ